VSSRSGAVLVAQTAIRLFTFYLYLYTHLWLRPTLSSSNAGVVASSPVGEPEEMMMLRALESSDKQQQITWRDQTDETTFTDLPGYIAAGTDLNSLPIDLLTDDARNLEKRWLDHNDSKTSSTSRVHCALLSLRHFEIS